MPKEKKTRTKVGRANPRSGRSPLILILGGAVLLIAALVFAIAAQPQPAVGATGGTPALKTDKAFVDLGDQKLGNAARVSFTLTNEGDGTLRFTKAPYVEVKEGC